MLTTWNSNREGTIHTLEIYLSSGIEVHRHRDYPDKWLLSGRGLISGIDKVILKESDLELAKKEAIERVAISMTRIADRLNRME